MAKTKTTPRPSGPTQAEGDRKRRQCLLRLSDEELADVDAVAERWGVSRSAAVARMARGARHGSTRV